MTAAEMEAIIGGYHGDPFSVLGPHPINLEASKTAWVIRAFLPQAKSACVELDGNAIPPAVISMEKCHRDGFFVADLKSEPGPYRFRIRDWQDMESIVEDPYRFGTIITDFDLHLHAEGTLYESWRSFGAHRATLEGVEGVRFAVWAPNAELVAVVGDFNQWDARRDVMRRRNAGVWEIF